jgi:hypothetical protein
VDDQENGMNSNTSLASGHGRANPLWRGSGLAAVVVCVAALAAACGGPGGSGDPGSGNGVVFAQCMRAHGVPNFPNPSGGQLNLSGVNQNSPELQHAAAICGRSPGDVAAQEAQGVAKALAFARCLRAHGVPNYPDPTVNDSGNGSSITTHVSSGSGVDQKSPVFQAAVRACRSLLPGDGKPGSSNGGSAR